MAKCSQCGAEVREGAKFCEMCGAKIEEKPQPNVCPQCGQEYAPGQAFCSNCGYRLNAPAPQEPVQEPIPEPVPEPIPEPVPEPIPEPAPAPEVAPMPAPAPEAAPAPAPQPAPQPVPAPAPAPMYQAAPAPQPVPGPMPQPGPAPMPQQAPYGQPAPQPYQQQPYYQQPMPQAPVANKAPLTPLQFVRSLILNIGAILIYFLMILPFVVPLIKGSSDNFFVVFGQLFNFDGVTSFAITIQVFNIFAFFLPLIGFLAYGTMALVSAIKGLVNKSLPRFEFLGFGLGMYAPMFLVACSSANVANNIVGFKFTVFDSPAFLIYYIAFILYMLIGLTGSYFSSFIEKRTIAGPIVKSAAVVVGIVLFTFAFGAVSATATNGNYSLSPMYCYSVSPLAFYESSGSNTAVTDGMFMFIHGVFYIVSVESIGLAMGELFSTSRRRVNRVNAIVFTSISSALSVLSIFCLFNLMTNSTNTFGMPSVCGWVVFVLVIAFMVVSNIAANKERPALVRPQMMPQMMPQPPRYY